MRIPAANPHSDRAPPTFSVAHVNTARNYRGGERQTELLVRELASRCMRQVLVARRGAPLCRGLKDLDVEIRTVSGNRLSVAAATHDIDVVHVHEGRSIYGAYIRSLISGTPYIVTRRVDNPIGGHWLAHRAYRGAQCVAAVSLQVSELLGGYDPRVRRCVIHDSSSALRVDERESAAIRDACPGRLLVGHVGALDRSQKAQDVIIEVAGRLERTYPDIHFILVGGGADERALQRAAAHLGNLTFVGFVDNVGDYLAAFDLFILPSRREGLGSILIDAMERGLPVIASRVGGVPSIVRDGENGLLIEPESPHQLEDAIVRLRSQPQLCRRLGERGREVARSFTASAMADRYVELYRAAAAR